MNYADELALGAMSDEHVRKLLAVILERVGDTGDYVDRFTFWQLAEGSA